MLQAPPPPQVQRLQHNQNQYNNQEHGQSSRTHKNFTPLNEPLTQIFRKLNDSQLLALP